MTDLPVELQPDAIRATAASLSGKLVRTPTIEWARDEIEAEFGAGTRVFVKYEALQRTGSFKVRGALNLMSGLGEAEKSAGVTAVSAGNHAMAVAWAARELGINARIAMPASASRYRRQKAEAYGAEIVLCDNVKLAFEECERMQREDGRTYVHPFNDLRMMQGSATCGLEFCDDVAAAGARIDLMLLSVGGGGFGGGFAASVHHAFPDGEIRGVEPEHARAMSLALEAGEVVDVPLPTSMADSLGSPVIAEPSFGICKQLFDGVDLVSESDLVAAMRLVQENLKVAVEPAGAATTAALFGSLKESVAGKTVGLVLCGANFGVDEYCRTVHHT